MSRKFLTPIDLSQQELRNAKIQNLASAPSSPTAGQIYWDTTLHEFGVWNDNSSAWVYLGSGGGTVTSASVVTANGFAGTVASSTTTPAITLTTSVTGILKGNGTAISAATSATDYAPATTGSSALKASSGGFATATINDLGSQTADYSANTHKITNLTDPASAQDAATKAYVDSAAAGIDWKGSVRAIATTNGTLATAYANSQVVDGVTLATGNRILLAGQTSGADNGIYTVNASGAPTRATDADTSAEVTAGIAVFVEEGTANADTGWVLTTNATITLGTTSLTFTQFTGLGEVTAGTGLSKSGNTMSIENSGVLLVTHGGSGAATLTGILKGNGTSPFTAATGGTDYIRPFTALIGDGSSTSIAVTHSLSNQYVLAQVFDASSNAKVECDITLTSSSVTTFGFAIAPATNAYRVVIAG